MYTYTLLNRKALPVAPVKRYYVVGVLEERRYRIQIRKRS